jgi:hypothetical protein
MNGGDGNPAHFDGATVLNGKWANMCSTHFGLYGVGLGIGRGQRLVLESEKKVGLSDEPILIRVETPACIECGKTSVVELTREEFARVAHPARPNIAECLPDRDLAFRELFITGTHPACWDAIMPKDEDQS